MITNPQQVEWRYIIHIVIMMMMLRHTCCHVDKWPGVCQTAPIAHALLQMRNPRKCIIIERSVRQRREVVPDRFVVSRRIDKHAGDVYVHLGELGKAVRLQPMCSLVNIQRLRSPVLCHAQCS